MKIQNNIQGPERAFLIGIDWSRSQSWEAEDSLEELVQLAETAGAKVFGKTIVKLAKHHAATFIGKGKVAELTQKVQEEKIQVVIFDDDLSPAQSGNLLESFGVRVIDRTQLILDIFARRARTKQSQFQVELAQLKYLFPRLTHQWTHLSRQEGGIGTRGPGEKQLEVDRRRLRTRMMKLAQELCEIEIERKVRKRRREQHQLPLVAIVGYTNAGKTTLFNGLTESANLAEDRLFATLDSTVRKINFPECKMFLLSDTVGFIRKLPHHLVESFKTTLEEVSHADLLIHVLDLSDHLVEEKHEVVMKVLKELHAEDVSRILVLNKVDKLGDSLSVPHWLKEESEIILISAKSGRGLDILRTKIKERLQEYLNILQLFIPHSQGDWVSLLHREGRVIHKKYDEKGTFLEVEVSKEFLARLRPFEIKGDLKYPE